MLWDAPILICVAPTLLLIVTVPPFRTKALSPRVGAAAAGAGSAAVVSIQLPATLKLPLATLKSRSAALAAETRTRPATNTDKIARFCRNADAYWKKRIILTFLQPTDDGSELPQAPCHPL